MVQWCWVKLAEPGPLIVGHGPTVFSVGADGDYLDIFSLVYLFFLPPSLWETDRYKLKYCALKAIQHKTINQHLNKNSLL